MKKTWAPRDERWKVFLDRLDGKQLTSPGRLTEREISFAQEISEIDGKLNFYLETSFNVDSQYKDWNESLKVLSGHTAHTREPESVAVTMEMR